MNRYDELVRTKETNYKFIQETSGLWNNSKCNSIEVLGPLMEHINDCFKYKEIFKFEDWETYFYNKVLPANLNNCYLIFKKVLDENNVQYTKKQVVDTILVHTILQTYEGYTREEIAKQFLQNQKDIIKIEKTTKEVDEKYFIDYILTLKNNKKVGLQVKSLSYLTFVASQKIDCNGKNSYVRMVEKMKSYDGCDYTFVIFVDEDRVAKASQVNFNSKLWWWLK